VLGTQRCELPTHLDQIKSFVVWLLFQMEWPSIKRRRRAEYVGATTSPGVDRTRAMSRARRPSAVARGRNRGLELSLMSRLRVNSGTLRQPSVRRRTRRSRTALSPRKSA
jgi:hypothetical protein